MHAAGSALSKSSIQLHLPNPPTPRLFGPTFFLTTAHDYFDSADPSSMQDACHIWTQLSDIALHEFSYFTEKSARPVFGTS